MSHHCRSSTVLLSVLEVFEENVEALALRAVVLDNNARAADDLAGVTLPVNLTQTGPGPKDLRVSNLDQVDVVLGAQRNNKLDVLGLRARLNKNAKVGLTLVERFGSLSEATGEPVMKQGVLKHLLNIRMKLTQIMIIFLKFCTCLEGILDRHLSFGCLLGNLDLSGGLDFGGISSVRHPIPKFRLTSSPNEGQAHF